MKKQTTNSKFEQYIQIQLDKEKLKLEKKAKRKKFWGKVGNDYIPWTLITILVTAFVLTIFYHVFHLVYWLTPEHKKQEQFDKYYRSSIAAKRYQWDDYDAGVREGKALYGSDAVQPKHPFNWTTNVIYTNIFIYNNSTNVMTDTVWYFNHNTFTNQRQTNWYFDWNTNVYYSISNKYTLELP